MTFRVKSAWTMALVMIGAGVFYLQIVYAASMELGHTAPPMVVLGFVFFVVVGSVLSQIVLAIGWPGEVNAPVDERERRVQLRAGHWSGIMLASGVVSSLGHFIVFGDGNMLFHLIVASLIVSQIAEYALHILFDRVGA